MSNKTISINPSLFSLGAKTKKVREKKPKMATPLISPNVLKNKLLKRIKEHKQRETENLDNNKTKVSVDLSLKTPSYSDEFSDSLNYLQTLSKQKKINDDKNILAKRKEALERKTVKNYESYHQNQNVNVNVNVDLPEELQEPLITVNTETMQQEMNSPPYGILKGGTKPTYRDWSKTQRNNLVSNPNNALMVPNSERVNRLQKLREKLKYKQLEETVTTNVGTNGGTNAGTNVGTNAAINVGTNDTINAATNGGTNVGTNAVTNVVTNAVTNVVTNDTINETINAEDIIAIKKITTRTIKKKYTLGKSKNKKTVAVLIKDRGTRKKIIAAQKELKKKPIEDVKIYLREHNLIKIGSNAPNDIIRKMYESSMLAGEISNNNSDILLHNFSKSDKEL
jgi:hypothetical protein